uniref:Fibulin-1 n=1 Tax=Monopterus albus TaxID=43700 RepID=A0A3Q3J531_MONAL
MAQWTILLFSLYGVLKGQDTAEIHPIEQWCCQDGRNRALKGQDCTILPPISDSLTCRIAQEQCCTAVIENNLCLNGIKMALGQGACEKPFFPGNPWETQISKVIKVLSLYTPPHCSTHVMSSSFVSLLFSGSNCSQLCVGNGTCSCHDGYQLQKDGVTCEDVNECLTGSHSCILGQMCINTEGSFRCQREISCGTGYELREDNSCQDIDECALEIHNCGPDFSCTNTAGSFRCHPKEKCPHGFIQDAFGSCIDINECLAHMSPCPPGQICMNTEGSYTCRKVTVTCGRGYHLSEDGTRCEDVDECHTGNVCGEHGCVNLVGSHRCDCKRGFAFNSITKLCEDINECRYYPGRLCAHKCENTEGSYQCSCTTGFKLSPDGRNCEDVNECEANPCNQECANVYGSYRCYCRRGYQLSDIDGITCEDIDECALPTGGHVCSYRCYNSPGSFYCACPPTGYTVAPNGHTCQDIDECASGSHTCSASKTCFNVQGGFRCLSVECPPNFQSRRDTSFSVRCIKACQANDIGCALNPVHLITHSFLSLPAFRDFSGPEEIVFLRTITAANHAHLPGATDISFEMLAADDQASFDVVKRSHQGTIMGVVRQVKPVTGPRDLVLKVALNYIRSGVISYRNFVIIHVFISEYWL